MLSERDSSDVFRYVFCCGCGPGIFESLLEAGAPAVARSDAMGHGLVTHVISGILGGGGKGGKACSLSERLEMLNLLVSFGGLYGDGLDDQGKCCLNWAAQSGWVDGVRRLLELGYPVEGLEGVSESPLYAACRCGQIGAAKLLLASGADPNAKNVFGMTTLMQVASREHLSELARENGMEHGGVLLEAGADGNLRDQKGGDELWHSRNAGVAGEAGAGAVAALIEAWRLKGCLVDGPAVSSKRPKGV